MRLVHHYWLKCPNCCKTSWAWDRKITPTETSALVGTWCTMIYLFRPRTWEAWMTNWRTTSWRSRLNLITWWIENLNRLETLWCPLLCYKVIKTPAMLRSMKPWAFCSWGDEDTCVQPLSAALCFGVLALGHGFRVRMCSLIRMKRGSFALLGGGWRSDDCIHWSPGRIEDRSGSLHCCYSLCSPINLCYPFIGALVDSYNITYMLVICLGSSCEEADHVLFLTSP